MKIFHNFFRKIWKYPYYLGHRKIKITNSFDKEMVEIKSIEMNHPVDVELLINYGVF